MSRTRRRYRIILVGPEQSGKTSLARRICHNAAPCSRLPSTIGIDFHSLVRDRHHVLGFWDTSGQDRFAKICRVFYRQGAAIWLCITQADLERHQVVAPWIEKIQQACGETRKAPKVVLVITKCDHRLPSPAIQEQLMQRFPITRVACVSAMNDSKKKLLRTFEEELSVSTQEGEDLFSCCCTHQ